MKKSLWLLNWYFICRVLGFILCMESIFMFLSSGLSFYYKGWDMPYLLTAGIITLLAGACLIAISPQKKAKNIGKRESFMTVSLSWLVFSLFGMLPFYFSRTIPSITDAFFETMSGLTTTGSTILTNVESLPKGLLFWRSLLQWLGGMGMIVFSLALLPLLGGGAVQLYDAETSGITHDKFRPRIRQIAHRISGIYLMLTLILILLLYLGPMDFFDALCHAISTVSTGGFSTKQNSIAYWDSTYIDTILCIFMILGSINFVLLYFLAKGSFKKVFKNEELRCYLMIIACATLIITFLLTKNVYAGDLVHAFRIAVFQVITLISSCGYATSDYIVWGPFYWIICLLLMIVCGCAGSTSGGMKVIRVLVLAKNTKNEFKKYLHPKAIIPSRIDGTALSQDVVQRVMSFVFLYMIIILISWVFLSLMGMKFDEALGAAITAIGNSGPGLGEQGPTGNFAALSAISKWYMAFLMMVGRLEIFTVLTLFSPGFWKKM